MKKLDGNTIPPVNVAVFDARSQEIGEALRFGRALNRFSVRECAAHIGTSRQRYAEIEAGRTRIHFVELEALITFFRIDPMMIWPGWRKTLENQEPVAKIRVKAGQAVTIVVEAFEPPR